MRCNASCDAQTRAVAAGGQPEREPSGPMALGDLQMWLARAERIRTRQRHDKNKLYALHAPEVKCISLGLAPASITNSASR